MPQVLTNKIALKVESFITLKAVALKMYLMIEKNTTLNQNNQTNYAIFNVLTGKLFLLRLIDTCRASMLARLNYIVAFEKNVSRFISS